MLEDSYGKKTFYRKSGWSQRFHVFYKTRMFKYIYIPSFKSPVKLLNPLSPFSPSSTQSPTFWLSLAFSTPALSRMAVKISNASREWLVTQVGVGKVGCLATERASLPQSPQVQDILSTVSYYILLQAL